MNRFVRVLAIGLAATVIAVPATAQTAPCSQAQPVVAGLLEAASKRLEAARLTNSAAAMRDAADDVQAALLDVRAQLAPCAKIEAAPGDAHAGHTMPAAPQTSSPAPSPAPSPAARPAPAPASPQGNAPAHVH